jgi:hypothetical protein
MRDAAGTICFVFVALAVGHAHAKPPPPRTPPHAAAPAWHVDFHPAQPLPMLPSVARIRVEAARDRVVVVEEVNLPRGEWRSGGLDLYVAFGAPGPPLAVDAHLIAVPPDSLESRLDEPGDALSVEPSIRRTSAVRLLLGPPQMAGIVVHIREADLRRLFATTDLLGLRVRSLLSPPSADLRGARDVVVRLGIVGDLPLTLGHIQLVSLEGRQWITRAEAVLCGPEADTPPLAISLLPRGTDPSGPAAVGTGPGPIAPVLAVRHASDDLCIRWWAGPT